MFMIGEVLLSSDKNVWITDYVIGRTSSLGQLVRVDMYVGAGGGSIAVKEPASGDF
jgi:hypothetical protein